MKGKKILAFSLGLALAAQVFQPMMPPVTVQASVHQESVSVFSDIYTDKAMYDPGDSVAITVELNNSTQEKITSLSMQPMHLNEKVGDTVVVPCEVDAFSSDTIAMSWTAPAEDFQGYLLEITAVTEDGTYLDTGSVAVDVSSEWTKFPRYGYVHDFEEEVDTQGKIDEMAKYHINAIEFYDWQYLHHQPLAPEEQLAQGYYEDWSGRKIYVSTIEDYISAAKDANMVSMAYDMIYAGTDTFYEGEENEVHKDWQIFFKDDNDRGNGQFYFTMGTSPSGNGHLYFVNPLNEDWQDHIFAEFDRVFDYFDFDGWHGDTVGDWGEMTDSQGQPLGYTEDGEPIYLVKETYEQFLNAAKAALGDKYLTFNPVGAQGIESANVSDVDALYTEFWPWDHDRYWDGTTEDANLYDTYNSLVQEVERSAQDSNGKSLVVKAYINYGAADGYMNTPAVILSNAAVLAAGGSKLEIGNGDSILHKEYYPDDKIPMSDLLKARMRNMYDFEVAYENLLRDGQVTTSQQVVTEGYANSSDGQADTIWTYTREGNGYQMLHMINLLGTDNQWRDEYKEKATPEKAENISVKYYYTEDVNSVYMASPDRNSGTTEALAFEKGSDEGGAYVTFEVPALEYWNMIYMSSEESTELNEANTNMQYKLTFEGEDYYEGNLSEGQADMQPGEGISFVIPEGLEDGEYLISVVSCGNRELIQVEKNGEAVGSIIRTGTGFGMDQMTENYMEESLTVEPGDVIKIYDDGVSGSGYGWVDKIVLTLKQGNQNVQQETSKPYEYPEGMLYKVEGESGETHALDTIDNHPEEGIYGAASEHKLMKNIGLNQGWVVLTIPEEVPEAEYKLVLSYSSGTDGKVNVWVNDTQYTLDYAVTDAGWSFVPSEVAIPSVTLKAGDQIKIQDAKDNCWIWIDYIYLAEAEEGTPDVTPDVTPEPFDYPEGMLHKVEGEAGEIFVVENGDGSPEEGIYSDASEGKLMKNIGLNQGWVVLTIPEDVTEDQYDLNFAYSSGTDGQVNVWVNDTQYTLDYTLTDEGWSFVPSTLSIPDVVLKAGDQIKIQDAKDNCWIWIDYMYLTEAEDDTPDVTPDVTPDDKPDVTPDDKPDVTPDTKPDVTPDTKPSTTPDNTDKGNTSGSNTTNNDKTNSSHPETGDSSNMYGYIWLAAVSGFAVVLVISLQVHKKRYARVNGEKHD